MDRVSRLKISANQARDAASQWVRDVAQHVPGFVGALLHGSINWLGDDAILSETSDLDVVVVLSGSDLPPIVGKFQYWDVLLDVSHLPITELRSAEVILANSHIAGSFRGASIIMDPSGVLARLQTAVSRDYAQHYWVMRRCEHARDKILTFLGQVNTSNPFHDQVLPWLFGTGVTTHVLLVAGLKNPTVRRRYVAVHDLLTEYGRLDIQEDLLKLLGCADMEREQVEHHLDAMTAAFDAARTVIDKPFFFASDISDIARPIAIDGSREMIEAGFHREAMFWITATYSRCQKVLRHGGTPESRERFAPGYRALLADLGIATYADLDARCEQVRRFLPRLQEIAETIAAANPEIEN